MNEIKQNVYYVKLSKYRSFLKPSIIFLVFIILMFIVIMGLLKLRYIPTVISLLQKECHPEVVALVSTTFKMIFDVAYFAESMFISSFLGLILIIRNINKAIDSFEISNKERKE